MSDETYYFPPGRSLARRVHGLRPLRRALPPAHQRGPGRYPEFRAWFDGRLASPDLHATPHALEMAPLVAFKQPVPMPARGNLIAQNQ